jgi:molybdopterin-guanine dinucleotide biosynthesis protein A
VREFNALVLAGERKGRDALLAFTRAPAKALVEVGGKPMIHRVVETLLSCPRIARILLSGPREEIWKEYLADKLRNPRLKWIPPSPSPSLSTYQGLEILGSEPVLLTTCDHALLTQEMVLYLLHRAEQSAKDLVVGVVRYETLKAAYPLAKRTTYRLRDGTFCSTNLYVFLTPASRRAVIFWRQIEEKRKSPLRIVRSFGLWSLLRYLTRRLTLEEAFQRVSKVFGCSVAPVILPFPEAAIDVDDPEDLALVNQILEKRGEKGS